MVEGGIERIRFEYEDATHFILREFGLTVTPEEKETQSVISRYRMRRQVRWTDTDGSGVIHAGAFVRLLEETEYGFLRSRGLSVVLTDQKGLMGFPRLSANVTMSEPLFFDDEVDVELQLVKIDGKMIEYDFIVTAVDEPADEGDVESVGRQVGSGHFKVAVCRFPANEPPYAVLTPEYVIEALTSTIP